MELEINKELFGFQPGEFETFMVGHAFQEGYTYKDKLICDILTYREDGHLYDYEDDDVIFYSPTEINENSMFFFKIKNKYLLTENESFSFYTNFRFEKEEAQVIMIEAVSKHTQNCYYWTYSTMDYLIETTKRLSQHLYWEYYPHDITWVLNRFLLIKNITKTDIIAKIQSLDTEKKIMDGFYR
ncbi:hypothetical protein [Chryseobacterium sp.]|uniref:hypothetical protein n=1 Tax=Chryseobacterium sp. TaxID=1871047 RepID=UPI0031DE136B